MFYQSKELQSGKSQLTKVENSNGDVTEEQEKKIKPIKTVTYANPKSLNSEDEQNHKESEKNSILKKSQSLESLIDLLRENDGNMTASQWLQMTDKIDLFYNDCMAYADRFIGAHVKFHFRELLTKLDSQTTKLKCSSSRHMKDGIHLLLEVHHIIEDIKGIVRR